MDSKFKTQPERVGGGARFYLLTADNHQFRARFHGFMETVSIHGSQLPYRNFAYHKVQKLKETCDRAESLYLGLLPTNSDQLTFQISKLPERFNVLEL